MFEIEGWASARGEELQQSRRAASRGGQCAKVCTIGGKIAQLRFSVDFEV